MGRDNFEKKILSVGHSAQRLLNEFPSRVGRSTVCFWKTLIIVLS